MDTDAAPVRVQIERGVACLTMDSPANRNALSTAMVDALVDAVAAAVADPAVRVILLTHAGPVFCSGADLKETAAALDATAQGSGRQVPAGRLGDVIAALMEAPKPVVARIAGAVRGGGLGLVAAADIAVCSTAATFAFSEVRVGVIPAVISAAVLPRLTSRAAAELYLTGATFDGVRAERIGLISAAVPEQDLDAAVDGYVEALRHGAPGALAGVKLLLQRVPAGSLREELSELTEMSVSYFSSAEGIEGMRAFREKRRPAWVSGY